MPKNKRTEHPIRLEKFRDFMTKVEWNERKPGLKTLYNEIDTLVHAEITYYYESRVKKRLISGILRALGILFATAGVLAPLVNATGIVPKECNLDSWGYVILALAAGVLGADKLFTGSSGHIRFVVTQLKLEAEQVTFKVKWLKRFSSLEENDSEGINALFDELHAYCLRVYKIIEDETADWKGELEEAMKELRQKIADAKNSGS